MADNQSTALLAMTTGIVANYVSNNAVSPVDLPQLIVATHQALKNAGRDVNAEEQTTDNLPTASEIRKSVSEAGIVSFIDGKTYQSLKRHLNGHEMTPKEYRDRYGLKGDYPMVSPYYSAKRSAIAKSLGLGQGGRKPKAARKMAGKSSGPKAVTAPREA
ncbi:MucR family transcriptional regulator [Brevundimonas sp. DC300-4]|uniref:MucR family transcriptional regulator n=1 Tax=Brevundimonas sp. DC300-4 TaxID=2804594 RepID=UPI003CEF6314